MKKAIFILGVLVLSTFIAACNENDISKIVKSLPDVQQFLKEHPNADMKIVYLDETAVAGKIADIRQQCTEDVKSTAMYYVEFKEGANTDLKMWLDAQTQQVLCAVKKGSSVVNISETNETKVINKIDNETLAVNETKVIPENETICIIQKVIVGGETATFNIGEITVVATVIGINTDSKIAMITVNGESKEIVLGETATLGGIRTNLSWISPYTVSAKVGAVQLTFSIDNCSASKKEEKFVNVSDEDVRTCSEDADCIKVNGDNCGCTAGGTATSINKRYTDYWNEKFPGGTCVAMISQHWSCGRSINPKCINNLCTLNETNYQQKIMTAGDTVTLNVEGTQAVVTLVGINTDTSTTMVTVNGESKQIKIGETDVFDEIKVYVNRISPYVVTGSSWAELFISKNKQSNSDIPKNETVELDETNLTLEYNLGKASCPTARAESGVGVIGSKIYFIAGCDKVNDVNTAEVYDVETNTCSAITSLSTKRNGLAVAVVDEKVYAFGGYSPGANSQNSAEVYDPSNNSWSPIANLPHTWSNMLPGVYNGKIYLATGENSVASYISDVYEYNPEENTYTAKTSIPSPQSKAAFAVYGSKLYLFGGQTTGNVGSYAIRSYDMANDSWEDHGTFPIAANEAAVAQFNNKFYIFAFMRNVTNIYSFDPATDNLSLTSLKIPVAKGTAAGAMYGDKFYLYGGSSPSQWFNDLDEITIR